MTEFIKQGHQIDLETVKELNKLLEGSGWTVGQLFIEASLLDEDITRAGLDIPKSETSQEAHTKNLFKNWLEHKKKEIIHGEELPV
jgi:hypothetical protein